MSDKNKNNPQPIKIQFEANHTLPIEEETHDSNHMVEAASKSLMNVLGNEKEFDYKNCEDYCPLNYPHYVETLVGMQKELRSYVFFSQVPIDCPPKPEDIIFSYIGTAPVSIIRPQSNGIMVRETFDLKFIANLVFIPSFKELDAYPDKNNPHDKFSAWRSHNTVHNTSYNELTKYAKEKNFLLLEHTDIHVLGNMIASIEKKFLEKRPR